MQAGAHASRAFNVSIVGQGTCPKYISLAGILWPSMQCGHATDIFKCRSLNSTGGLVSIAVATSCNVFGQRYVRTLIFLPRSYANAD